VGVSTVLVVTHRHVHLSCPTVHLVHPPPFAFFLLRREGSYPTYHLPAYTGGSLIRFEVFSILFIVTTHNMIQRFDKVQKIFPCFPWPRGRLPPPPTAAATRRGGPRPTPASGRGRQSKASPANELATQEGQEGGHSVGGEMTHHRLQLAVARAFRRAPAAPLTALICTAPAAP